MIFFFIPVGLGCKGPFLQERHSQPKKSTTNYLPHRPMQRSLSVSSVPTTSSPLSNRHRVVIRPDPKFTQFNPEDEDEDSENEMENSSSQEIFHDLRPSPRDHSSLGGGRHKPHGLRSRLSLQHPLPPSRGRLGSLSNLSAVSEAPLTAHAVSPNQQPLPPQPRMLYHSPYGTIREEQHDKVCMRTNRDHSYRVTTNSDTAWSASRRNSLHSQPQPLSVQGFGHRFNPRRYSTIEGRSRAAMVAGRLLGVHPGLEDSRSSVMAQRKFSSPACVEAVYNHSTRRPASQQSSHVPNFLVRF